MKRPHTTDHEKICKSALTLLTTEEWDTLALDQIEHDNKVPHNRFTVLLPHKTFLIPLVMGWIDQQLTESLPPVGTDTSTQDRLFDVLMTRFEIMHPHKAGIIKMAQACRKRPELAIKSYKAQSMSIHHMANLANLTSSKSLSTLIPYGLLGLYHTIFLEWERDNTEEMASTMAKLNHILNQSKISVFFAPTRGK